MLAAVLGWGGERRETPTSEAGEARPMGQSAGQGQEGSGGKVDITWGRSMPSVDLYVPLCHTEEAVCL